MLIRVLALLSLITVFNFSVSAEMVTQVTEANQFMGQGLYDQKGSNSCQYCHGIKGNGGAVATAADLTQPKTWKVYKALGGDAAFNANKVKFLKNMKEATVHLIEKGAVAHNKKSFSRDWFQWDLSGSYNSQMLGIRGAPSARWYKKYKNRGVTKTMASEALYLYIKTMDSQGLY